MNVRIPPKEAGYGIMGISHSPLPSPPPSPPSLQLRAQIDEQRAAKAAAGIVDPGKDFVAPESMGVEMDPLVFDGASRT